MTFRQRRDSSYLLSFSALLNRVKLGPYSVDVPVMLAPMAGMSDLPFREVCRELGAGYAVGEMTTSKPEFRESRKSATRWACEEESGLRVVQLLGADPVLMADAARYAVDSGADVVDINMGCPAKKVLQTACGSALLRDEALVARILEAVCGAVTVPVTLKIRTGWDRTHINALRIAAIAEESGIAMLTVHGRTREDGFHGCAEYDTIRRVKTAVTMPVIANGDIDSAVKAARVMKETGVDGVMIGRASYGNPWIFSEVSAALGFAPARSSPDNVERRRVILMHMRRHFDYYGEARGAVTFRKHLVHYLKGIPGGETALKTLITLRDPAELADGLERFLARNETAGDTEFTDRAGSA